MSKPAAGGKNGAKSASKKQPAQKKAAGGVKAADASKSAAPMNAANDGKAEGGGSRRKAVAAALVALAVVAAALMFMNAGGMAKSAVEKIASRSLGVPVTLAGLDISLQERQITVTGLEVANPEGFSGQKALRVESIVIAAEQISAALLVLETVKVAGASLHLEVASDGTNFTTLRDNVRKNVPTAAPAPDSVESPETATATEKGKVIVRQLLIEQAQMTHNLSLASTAAAEQAPPESAAVTLPDISIRNIGEAEGGVAPDAAIAQVVQVVVQVATKAALEQGLLAGMNVDSLRLLQDQYGIAPGLIDRVKNLFQDFTP